ncbi:MAG: hypothetical protein FJ135_16305 [Deltaproteobacteria bacterium]|nr:hypothetical protein [Deltaproteobacteria bacterium]
MSSEYAAYTSDFRTAADLANNFAKACWNDINLIGKLSAELASLRALEHYYETELNPPQPLGQGDQAIFIHSNNEQGRFCANCIRVIFEKFELMPDVTLQFEEISDLDPQFPMEFQGALQTLWSFCLGISEEMPVNDRLIFNLTGGYKVMGLVLASLSTIAPVRPSIIYLHETTAAEQLHIYCYDDRARPPHERLVGGFYEPSTSRNFIPNAIA